MGDRRENIFYNLLIQYECFIWYEVVVLVVIIVLDSEYKYELFFKILFWMEKKVFKMLFES